MTKTKSQQSAAQKSATGLKVIVRQTRSAIGRDDRVRNTLCALGLGRIGDEQAHTLNDSVSGMIDRVKNIVRVRKA